MVNRTWWVAFLCFSSPVLAEESAVKWIRKAERRVLAYVQNRGDIIGEGMREQRLLYARYEDRYIKQQNKFGDYITGGDMVIWDEQAECYMIGERLLFKGKLAFVKDGVVYVRIRNTYKSGDFGSAMLTADDRRALREIDAKLSANSSHIHGLSDSISDLDSRKKPGRNRGLNNSIDAKKKQRKQLSRDQKNLHRAISRIKAAAGKRVREAQHLLRVELGDDWLPDTMPGKLVKLLCEPEIVQWDAEYVIPTMVIDARLIRVSR